MAVIDIGSNSVRQVVYEGLSRAPALLFNEKVLCGLGQGLANTGRMSDEGVERALAAIGRFMALGRQIGVRETFILATAAARDAENGPAFIEEVERLSGCHVEVLSGESEALYSAYGIRSGFHHPDGIVGDMGGGSLELVGVGAREISGGITLPLGGLRLRDLSGDDLKKAQKIAREHIVTSDVRWPGNQKVFYAVGGTWRALGKLHMSMSAYPLRAVHDYELPADELKKFCERVLKDGLESIPGYAVVSRNRRDLLPYGVTVMREVIEHLQADTVAISSLGVREGFLYSRLSENEREKDALLVAAKDLSTLRARAPRHCEELSEWTGMAFNELGIIETENERRYRIASCYLADIGWRAHTDFRADQSIAVISNTGFVAIDHEGRAYLAIANFHRYEGLGGKVKSPAIGELASPEMRRKARLLAAMLRVLYLYSGSMPDIIPKLGLRRLNAERAVFTIPHSISALRGERPAERLRQMAKELGMEIEEQVVPG